MGTTRRTGLTENYVVNAKDVAAFYQRADAFLIMAACKEG
jgi:hypothetical protein